ncbi:methyltransferase [Corynebacterium sp. 3HC-13]|uniref:class I SAM-dependent methyltransferase n=1 Tax=Corynebacterium poyangense TaxID=2684405 RepID=UPI00165D1634|nr:class I SAM-dependent methyltransferase [Corynebacterium poyangense]MBZ8177329.1 methyltransferase [Corynebacterium poyangense]
MRRLLDRINDRHLWDHNEAFYPWILNHLPEKRRFAIDVGCGRGELLMLLGQHFPQVIGVEIDPAMILASQQRCAGYSHVKVTGSLENCAPQSDLITMVASLHHMEIEETLEHVVDKLAPGGNSFVWD